ncbi:hypothetical protein CPB83DRAFT_832655 [Crepidotus variabilis]|uniref:Uncharacterized protein n=1 Tax=Crepidotus variabilis TaxID=179855 RepID=A0A9P6EPD8_9AGAR|nr:hypothetical protein CPB83DRAFT_832655 [Crepidotus variabilis]
MDGRATNEEVVETVSRIPHLESLSIEGSNVDENLISLMDAAASSNEGPQFLPRIKSLNFSTEKFGAWSWPILLLSTLKNRPGRTLTRFGFGGDQTRADEGLIGKYMLEHMIVAGRGLTVGWRDKAGIDVLERLCRLHGVEFPPNVRLVKQNAHSDFAVTEESGSYTDAAGAPALRLKNNSNKNNLGLQICVESLTSSQSLSAELSIYLLSEISPLSEILSEKHKMKTARIW